MTPASFATGGKLGLPAKPYFPKSAAQLWNKPRKLLHIFAFLLRFSGVENQIQLKYGCELN